MISLFPKPEDEGKVLATLPHPTEGMRIYLVMVSKDGRHWNHYLDITEHGLQSMYRREMDSSLNIRRALDEMVRSIWHILIKEAGEEEYPHHLPRKKDPR